MAKREKSVLDVELAAIRKEHGQDTAARLGEIDFTPPSAVSTGILSLDLAIGVGGFPRGRISEVFGPESHGKTAVALHTVAQAQRSGLDAAFVDAENAFDKYWAAGLGVDVESLILVQPRHGEQALEISERLIDKGAQLVVVDSVAQLIPRAELEGEIGQSHMGLQARLVSQACRKLSGLVARSEAALIFTNQIRDKMNATGYGPTTDTTGGHMLKHAASVRVEVKKILTVKEGDAIVGIRVRARVVKNRVAPAHQQAEFEIYSGVCACHRKGVDFAGDVFDLAVEHGLVEKSGGWYSLDGQRFGQGRNAAAAALAQDAMTTERVVKALLGGSVEDKE